MKAIENLQHRQQACIFGNNNTMENAHNPYPQPITRFTVPTPMTDFEVAPPTHVWDRICRVLDEQDRQKLAEQNAFETVALPVSRGFFSRKTILVGMTIVIVAGLFYTLA